MPLLLRPLAAAAGAAALGRPDACRPIGDQLYAVALVWVAVSVFGAAAGYLSALQAACGMAAALLAGRWADGWEQRRAMAAADLLRAAVLLLLVGWWFAGGAAAAGRVWCWLSWCWQGRKRCSVQPWPPPCRAC